ncbi:MAG TPA: hypothetical protein DCM27_07100, partial [Rhodospirillaceae bacterium]|nr:hypothetical protein [Rhodospirillaceae bacterium]
MKNFISILLLCVATLSMTACSEIEFGSAMYKKFNRPPTTDKASQGVLKVGKPYTVMGKTYYPQETYDYVET